MTANHTMARMFLICNLALSLGLLSHAMTQTRVPLLSETKRPGEQFKTATVAQVASHLIHKDAAIVDARAYETYRFGHIPTAVNVPVEGGIPVDALDDLLSAPQVVVYCDGPDCGASAKAAQKLLDHGVKNISIMREGWPGWLAAGQPVMTMHKALPQQPSE